MFINVVTTVVFYLVFDILNIITVSIANPTHHTYEADKRARTCLCVCVCVCVCAYVVFLRIFSCTVNEMIKVILHIKNCNVVQ